MKKLTLTIGLFSLLSGLPISAALVVRQAVSNGQMRPDIRPNDGNSANVHAEKLELSDLEKNLLQAAEQGNDVAVRKILTAGSGFDLHHGDKNGCTALHLAARNGHVAIVSLLLDFAEKKNVRGRVQAEGDVPLGKTTVSMTRQYINFRNKHSMNALHEALRAGNVAIARLLMKKGSECKVHALYNKDYEGPECSGRALHVAAQGGNLDCLKLILEKDKDVHFRDVKGRTPLHYAALCGHEEIYMHLCTLEAYEDEKDKEGTSPRHYVAFNGHDKLLGALLKRGILVDKKDKNGKTLLHHGAERGHHKIIEKLIEEEAEVNIADSEYKTPLYYAIEKGSIASVKLLIEHNGEVRLRRPDYVTQYRKNLAPLQDSAVLIANIIRESKCTASAKDSNRWKALLETISRNDTDSTRMIVESANLKARLVIGEAYDQEEYDKKLAKTLRRAASHNSCALIELLLEAGADPLYTEGRYYYSGSRPNDDRIALFYAVENNHIEATRLLLTKGSPFKKELTLQEALDGLEWKKERFNKYVRGALKAAIKNRETSPEIVNVLVEAGADPLKKYRDGRTTLHLVAQSGNAAVAQLLIDKKVPVNSLTESCNLCEHPFNWEKYTPLFLAAVNSNTEVFNVLLQAGADPAVQNSNFQTPLHAAAASGSVEIVQALLDKKVPCDEKDSHRHTPLLHAMESKNLKNSPAIVKLLVDAGADRNQKSGYDTSLIDLAVRRDNYELVRQVLELTIPKENVKELKDLVEDKKGSVLISNHFESLRGLNPEIPVSPYGWKTQWLAYACYVGDLNAIEKLLDCGADIDGKGEFCEISPLMRASQARKHDVINYLFTKGALPNVPVKSGSKKGWTALHYAINNNDPDLVKKLTMYDKEFRDNKYRLSNFEARYDSYGGYYFRAYFQEASHLALRKDHFACVDAMADVLGDDWVYSHLDGENATDYALGMRYMLYRGDQDRLTSIIDNMEKNDISDSFDWNQRRVEDNQGDTLLHLAVRHKSIYCVRIVLDKGADMTLKDADGKTAYEIAVENKDEEMIRILVEHKSKSGP